MRSLRGLLAFLSAVLLVLAVAAPAAATRGQPELQVPFRMSVVAAADEPLNMSPGFPIIRDTFSGRCTAPSDWVTTINSRGTASQLGQVSVTQSHCTQINIFTAPPLPAIFADGQMVITAANGDQLRLEYTGSFLFTPTSAEDTGISNITYAVMTVVGGTGRFAGASGSISGSAVDIFPAGPNVAHFSGTITFDASNSAER